MHAWGWGIIGLTIVVRVLLLPLAIKQTRSMRAMQKLAPQIKELQKRHKVDRELMRKDPAQYRARKQKLNQETMELYRREKANPAASCLPLLAQTPVFIALFATLWRTDALNGQPFYFITSFTNPASGGLEIIVRDAGWPGWVLLVLMSGTMFWSQKQMMARTQATQGGNPMAQQQKVMLYALPVFLGFVSLNFPLGILLYWVTTNFWQIAQQAIILREVQGDSEPVKDGNDAPRLSPGASSGQSSTSGRSASSGKPRDRSGTGDDNKKRPNGDKARRDKGGNKSSGHDKDATNGGNVDKGSTGSGEASSTSVDDSGHESRKNEAEGNDVGSGKNEHSGNDSSARDADDTETPGSQGEDDLNQKPKRDHLPRRRRPPS
ncbi:MAG: membrane protein insertase YidC [Nitriliruptoraceae bacterium]